MVSDKKIFSCFTYISLCKTCDRRGVAILGPRGIIWINFVEVHYVMLHIKYQSFRACGFREEGFFKFSFRKSIFSLCHLGMQWTGTIWTIFKEGLKRIIPTKFGKNLASSLGGDVIWSNCWRRKTDIQHHHNSSPWANGSGEPKRQKLYTPYILCTGGINMFVIWENVFLILHRSAFCINNKLPMNKQRTKGHIYISLFCYKFNTKQGNEIQLSYKITSSPTHISLVH